MPTAESRVAKALNITEAEAGEFISLVRGMFGEPPGDEWIVGCLEAVAVRLRTLGWVSARRKQESVSGRNRQERILRPKKQKDSSHSKDLKRRKPREHGPSDKTRVPGVGLGICPHGIPKTSLCAICDRERFDMLGDPD